VTSHSTPGRETAPFSNLLRDEPARVWRSEGTTAQLTCQVAGEWDTFALVGNNLRATDTIRLRAGATLAALDASPPLDLTFVAWFGTAPLNKAISFHLLSAPSAYSFVRIDINSPGNPDGFIEASRLVLGSRVATAGININAERQHMDGSVIEDGPGYTTIQEYRRRLQWKVAIGPILASQYYGTWDRFLNKVGKSRGFLFIEDTNSPWVQSEAAFVRNQADAKSVNVSSSHNKMEMTLLQV
jgi:hypothetical protein